jgi:23S rRNA pseudouridine2605 synthase
VDAIPDAPVLAAMQAGVVEGGEFLRAKSVLLLRAGEKHAWLEIVLDEGRNRQIRRLLTALNLNVLRLVRVAIGPLALGDLPKGQWRELSVQEVAVLGGDD